MTRKNLILALGLAVLLGCAGGEDTKAQEKPASPDAKQDDGKPAPKPADKGAAKGEAPEKVEDMRKYRALVTDRFNTPDFEVTDAVVWVPEVSLLGAEGGTAKKELLVKRGAAELIVPFSDIAWIEFREFKEDRLEVAVKRVADAKSDDPKVRDRFLVGTIKSNLQLRGKYEKTALDARLKLREVLKVVLQPMEEK
jgi:hypothetical protein